MKKNLFVLLLFPCLLFGQDKTMDSLKLALKNASHDTIRCNILNQMVEAEPNSNIWPKYNEELKILAEKNIAKTSKPLKIYFKHLASAIGNMGYIYSEQGNSQKALECYQKGLKISEDIDDKESVAGILNNIGYVYQSQGDISKALDYFQKSVKIQEVIGNKEGTANSLTNIGMIYQNQGDIPMALEYYHKSLKTFEEGGKKEGIAISLNNIGVIYQNLGDYLKALEYFKNSLQIRKEIGDKKGMAQSLLNLAYIYDIQGNIPSALDFNYKSLKLCEELGNKEGIANALDQIGTMYKNQGDLHKSLDFYLKSLKINEEIGNKSGIAEALTNVGIIYRRIGDPSITSSKEESSRIGNTKALEYFKKSLKISEELDRKAGVAASLNNIARIYMTEGDPSITSSKEEAIKAGIPIALNYLIKSLKILEEIGYKEGIATTQNNVAILLIRKGQFKEAFLYATKGMLIAKEIGAPDNIMKSAQTLKTLFQKQNNYQKAFENYELEIKMRDSVNNLATQKATIKKQMQYAFEKKAALDSTAHAKETEIKNAEITARKAELKVKQNTQYALYGGLALVMIFGGFMYNRFKVTQKQKQVIEIKEKETQFQKHIIEEKHKEITDSINYAERIQRSFIATKEILDENLNDYFVLFKPKDIVSGDFYWASKLNNGNFALVTADSTGHGVPGAIMSLLNITSLEKAIETLSEPSEILNSTRKTIIERLKKDGSEHGGKDGMDASLTVYDFKNKKIIIASANNPVWIMRGAELIDVKADKMPIGKGERDSVLFTQQEIDLQQGDVIYTLTDGFPDQFGGDKGKKFMSKKLKELLAANSQLPMQDQKQLLEKTFADWVGNLEQVDDVTLIGVRV
ncbi:MAG: tetratricopeptide repeat protein [Bacteroidota bacterium]|nr:tetratricopeptide repeat protein [Bacteroidota bacterium]MDP3147215.1 tetratricopeptide repeat protein [Bacteroidota bacterium]